MSTSDDHEIELLKELYAVIQQMPFGSHPALPWCRESFPRLDEIINALEKLNEVKTSEKHHPKS